MVELYTKLGRIKEGLSYSHDAETKRPWPNSREWYKCIVQMSEYYQVGYSFFTHLDNHYCLFRLSIWMCVVKSFTLLMLAV